jgi:phenylalanine-4-hydroxylase
MSSSIYDHPLVVREMWESYSPEQHARWAFMFNRQNEILKNRATDEVLDGMRKLNICNKHIPKFTELNEVLEKETGFGIIPVKGLLPEDIFFRFLSERKFPGTTFIRREDQVDYLQEPDIFHEIFGHVPLLMNPVFADFMEAFGRLGLDGIQRGYHKYVSALYWFTVEFGLIMTDKGLRIYGAGITSSIGESVYSLESKVPVRSWFDPVRAMKTKYRIDNLQKNYFVIRNYEELFSLIKKVKWEDIHSQLFETPDIEEGTVTDSKELIQVT